ncbi:M15 family metallopeptidase [Oleiharenicola lentus]|uniref:M15 family metallopeptidase n=1 Tax=Oleiharenicola lentus TaxID=2508720 RepID=UPI003F676DBC
MISKRSRFDRRKVWAQLGIPADYPRTRHMPVQREARTLVSIGRADDDGKILRMLPAAAAAWKRMRTSGAGDGVKLLQLSGYRSTARQTKLIRRKLAAGQTIEEVLRYVAAPGCSEHHTGRALDIGSPQHCELDEDFAKTPEFRWLKKNAARFGFHLSYPRGNAHGIGYEPWHWCWRR